jgi:hypothetical protein
MPSYIGMEWVWAESAVCSRDQSDLRRIWRRLFGEQGKLLEGAISSKPKISIHSTVKV